ncbi:MAG: hypothetical protein M1819_003454 [Sarea resinae]|nr:MAG: hypothetical protein M1819_003454 [Sarea resinae]
MSRVETASQSSTPKSEEPCALERLSPEILLAIVTKLDLPSLHRLLHASPATFRLFDGYAVEITESILETDPMTRQIPETIHVVALIRSSELPYDNLDDFIKRYISASLDLDWGYSYIPPTTFPKTTSPAILRGILASAHQISCLMLTCLRHYLDRVMAISPERPVDKAFTYNLISRGDVFFGPAFRRRPESESYAIEDAGPPTWVEEQRVTRGFWRVQLFHDLKTAAAHSRLGWPKEDVERLQAMEPIDLYNEHYRGFHFEFEEIQTVVDYTRELEAGNAASLPPVYEVKRSWPSPKPGTNGITYIDGSELRIAESMRMQIWENLSTSDASPLRYFSFKPFRRLGFAFWVEEKLSALGFMDYPSRPERWGELLLRMAEHAQRGGASPGREDTRKVL